MSTPAGWYPQPDGRQRYWDGEMWTEHFAPGAPVKPTVGAAVTTQALAKNNWFLNHKVLTGAGAALLLVMFMGVAYGSGTKSITMAPVADPVATSTAPDQAALDKAAAENAAADKAAAEAAAKEAADTQAALDKAAADQAAADKAAADKAAAARAAKRAAAAKAATPTLEVFKMPNLIGENLQLAQDKLQALGSYVLDQEDAAGLDRIQVLDSNWTVCSQNPAPGKTVSVDTLVILASVKLSEQCP